jgi:hypothetical protein
MRKRNKVIEITREAVIVQKESEVTEISHISQEKSTIRKPLPKLVDRKYNKRMLKEASKPQSTY